MSRENTLVMLELIIKLNQVSASIGSKIQQAQAEGRDISKSEVDKAQSDANTSLENLKKALGGE
jgi:hypothetical protein